MGWIWEEEKARIREEKQNEQIAGTGDCTTFNTVCDQCGGTGFIGMQNGTNNRLRYKWELTRGGIAVSDCEIGKKKP